MDELKQFATEDGVALNYRRWPSHDTAPCVIYLHGLESHLGWFSNMAEFLNSNGMNVYAFDRRSSGLNKDNNGGSCTYLSSDLRLFIDLVKREHPDSKVFLIGLCLGGKIAVNLFSSDPRTLDGLVLVSPSIRSTLKFSIFDKLSILLNPDKSFKIPIEDTMFTTNKKYLEYIDKDEGRLKYIKGRFLLELVLLDRNLDKASGNIKLPVLLMLAGIDKIIDTEKVKRWFEKLPSTDKTIKIYKDYQHILTFEENSGEVMEDMVDWIWMRSNVKSIAS